MNSLELLSKQYDVLATAPTPATPPTTPTTAVGPAPRRIRRPSNGPRRHRFTILRLLFAIWSWLCTQLTVLTFRKKAVTISDLDLDEDGSANTSTSMRKGFASIAEVGQETVEDEIDESPELVPTPLSAETADDEASQPSQRKLRQRTPSPTSIVFPSTSLVNNSTIISLNSDYPDDPSLVVASSSRSSTATLLASPTVELTPPTPNRHVTPLPLPQTLLLNPHATSLLITHPKSKRRKDSDGDSFGNDTMSGSPKSYGSPSSGLGRSRTSLRRPKTLVLDLDETLIHSTSRTPANYGSYGQGLFSAGGLGFGIGSGGIGFGIWGGRKAGPGHMVEVVLGGRSTLYHVYKRPFVDYFLKKVSGWYTLVVFTASMQEYADPVIDWLDAGRGILAKRFFRESCTQLPNGTYSKDLSLVDPDLSRVALLDNSPVSYSACQANGIPIEGWTSDPHDEALLDLLPFLDSLRFTSDVRRVLGIRGF